MILSGGTVIFVTVKEIFGVWNNLHNIILFNTPINNAQGLSAFMAIILGIKDTPISATQFLYYNMICYITLVFLYNINTTEDVIMDRDCDLYQYQDGTKNKKIQENHLSRWSCWQGLCYWWENLPHSCTNWKWCNLELYIKYVCTLWQHLSIALRNHKIRRYRKSLFGEEHHQRGSCCGWWGIPHSRPWQHHIPIPGWY